MKGRVKTAEEKEFIRFVMNNCGCPDGGTATSYETALYVLNCALSKAKPEWIEHYDIWNVDGSDLAAVYKAVLAEQRAYIKHGGGIFAAIEEDDIGRSYYEKRWCSAALKYLIRFREAQGIERTYENSLEVAIEGKRDPVSAAKAASKVKVAQQKIFMPKGINPISMRGKEIIRQVKVRCNQHVFRKTILNNYQCRCCVSGLASPQLLDAAHISDWVEDLSNALDATNGLCLSATYHRAFDAHLIGFDEKYRLQLSKSLKDCCTKDVYDRYFKGFENHSITMPIAFAPDKDALAKHFAMMVA